MTEETLFELALSVPEGKRESLLARECGGDARLRARVEALLAAHFAADDPTDKTRQHQPRLESTSSLSGEVAGTMIAGRYKLLQQIGEGGMGTVWMADQTEPVKRRVAVKLIRVERGSSRTVLARFEAERQAIALMDHPNIAKLLDAGTTGDGVPFFVMELVKGVPLNEYCDAHRLGIPERLSLFMQVCGAVQHAHQKGIIHRDLKPTNILVESHDDKPVPKVIDFGLAKATTGMQLTEHTLFTAFGSVMGTPLYMAPEQAKFNAVDVDTRADVYALGVILYELLTGTTPLTRDSMKKAALDEMLKLIREQEAPTPSSRLSSSGSQPSVAANRQTEPAKLGRYLKGELDWIVLKALSKERDRRYDSANGFAKDLERFLNHEAVSAGPPTARYRFGKFVRRNRGQVIAASLVLLALLAGIAGTTWGLIEARHQASLARDAQNNEAEQRKLAEGERDEKEKSRQDAVAEKERADREKAIAEAVRDFVANDIFERAGDLALGQSSEIKARVLLERAAANMGDRFKERPEIELAVRMALAKGFESIGMTVQASAQYSRSLELSRLHRPQDHADTLACLERLGEINNTTSGLALYREAYAGRCRTLGESHTVSLRMASRLAWMLHNRQLQTEAIRICEQAIALGESVHGKDAVIVRSLRGMKARITQHSGGYPEAEKYALDALQRVIKEQGENSAEAYWKAANLADLWITHRHYDRVEPLAEVWIEKGIRLFGATSTNVNYLRAYLAESYRGQNKHLLAGKTFLDVAQINRLNQGASSGGARTNQSRGVEHLKSASRLDLAVDRAEAWARTDHPDDMANAVSLYGMIVQQCKDEALAEKSTVRAMELLRRAASRGWSDGVRAADEFRAFRDREDFRAILTGIGRERPSVYPSVLAALARTHQVNKEYSKASVAYRDAIRTLEIEIAKQAPNHAMQEQLADYHTRLGEVGFSQLAFSDGEKSLIRAAEIRMALFAVATGERRILLGNQAAWDIHNQGMAKFRLGDHDRAAAKLDEAFQLREKLFPEVTLLHDVRIAATRDLDWLGHVWAHASRWSDAERVWRKALDLQTEMMEANFENVARRSDVDSSQQRLAEALVELKRYPEAAEILRRNVELYRKTNPQSLDDALMRLGTVRLKAEEWPAADTVLKECLELREKKIPDDWRTFDAMALLGAAKLGLKQFGEGEKLLITGCEGMIKRSGATPADARNRLHEAIDRLIELHTAKNRPDEVKRWRAERAKYPNIAPLPHVKP